MSWFLPESISVAIERPGFRGDGRIYDWTAARSQGKSSCKPYKHNTSRYMIYIIYVVTVGNCALDHA